MSRRNNNIADALQTQPTGWKASMLAGSDTRDDAPPAARPPARPAARPKGRKQVKKTYVVWGDQHERLQELASASGGNLNAFFRAALDYLLTQLEEGDIRIEFTTTVVVAPDENE